MKDRIKKLEENIKVLREFAERYKLEDIKRDKIIQWALKYGIYSCITGIGEISCGVIIEKNLGSYRNYKDCLAILGDNNILDKFLVERLIKMLSIKDLLKKPYLEIDLKNLYDLLENLEIYNEFISSIKAFTK
ncbi:MAG: HepT-like ribonuclease domain-containing protein [Dictyoglomaceae bacterium]